METIDIMRREEEERPKLMLSQPFVVEEKTPIAFNQWF